MYRTCEDLSEAVAKILMLTGAPPLAKQKQGATWPWRAPKTQGIFI